MSFPAREWRCVAVCVCWCAQSKMCIHRGEPYERLGSFIKRLTDDFTTAQVIFFDSMYIVIEFVGVIYDDVILCHRFWRRSHPLTMTFKTQIECVSLDVLFNIVWTLTLNYIYIYNSLTMLLRGVVWPLTFMKTCKCGLYSPYLLIRKFFVGSMFLTGL